MPHRTVFQWGKNHAHPFTMFLGGFVIGCLVTGTIAWAWILADQSNVDIQNALTGKKKATVTTTPKASASPLASPKVSPSASPQF